MSIKTRIVTTMLSLYPRAWRDEYGLELSEILLERPLTTPIIVNIVWNGAWQRARAAEPSTILGLGAMLVLLAGLITNIVSPVSADHWPAALLQDSHMTLPRLVVAPLAPDSNLYVLCLVACGCWTTFRQGPGRSVGAAMKMTLIAGSPVMAAGILMLFDLLHLVAVGPADLPLAGSTHGLTYTYYSAEHYSPSRIAILFAPLFALGPSIIWGGVGGWIGRLLIRRQHRQASF